MDGGAGQIRKRANWIVIESAVGVVSVAGPGADRADLPPDNCLAVAVIASGPNPHSVWA